MNMRLAVLAEEYVANQLIQAGYQILARNARHIGFELDIIAWQQPTIAIVEVKMRKHKLSTLYDWEQLLPHKKRLTMLRGGKWAQKQWSRLTVDSIRFDLAMVTLDDHHDRLSLEYYENLDLCFDWETI